MRRLITTAAAIVLAAVLVPSALAATATPFGGATTSGGVLRLVSNTGDAGATNDFSGASFAGTGVTTFASITTLSTEFNVTDDDCAGGSPRFQVRVQTPAGEKNVFVYLGPTPSFTGCSQNVWIASGNLIGSPDGRYDTSQVQAGTQVSTHAQALALVGSYQVTGISLVVDSGWALTDKEQTVDVRNVKVNASTFFEPEGTKPPQAAGAESGPGVREASRGDGRRRLSLGIRQEPERCQRVRQVRLAHGAAEGRPGAGGRRRPDRRRSRPVHRAHDLRQGQGPREGQGPGQAPRQVPREGRVSPTVFES